MLTPRELEVLDVVGEVMQERLQEVRKEYEGKLSYLYEKVAALEARPEPDVASQMVKVSNLAADALTANMDERFKALGPLNDRIVALETRPLPDVAPLTDKIAALETRAPEVTLEAMRKMGDDLEEVIERRLAMLPPPPDLTPLNEKFDLLQARGVEIHDHLVKAVDEAKVDHINLDNLHERVMAMEAKPPVDLEPLTAKLAELETRPTNEEVLKLAEGALHSTRASMIETLQISMVDLFKALPIPEKGDKGEPGINGTSVTAEQFRDLFEASYAKFELETERRIMDLVQRTLDRVPVPKDGAPGKDGFGFDDLSMTFDGERTLAFRFEKGERVTEFPFVLPYPLDKNVWKTGTAYVRGDGVTWGGSWWIAQRDNPGKPDDGPDCGWRLAVKHGRDGKPGTPGLKGDPGKDAKPTREQPNGTMRGSTEP